jgi:hypothetical protein
MKFINLKPLTIQRLKAYRRSLEARVAGYEVCWCGSQGCTHAAETNKDNPNYINLRTCLDRVNKELARKQMAEQKKNPANVPTVKEDKAKKQKRDLSWSMVTHNTYYRHRNARRKAKAEEDKRGPGRTVIFHYEYKGLNAHVADGSFTYDTPEFAQKMAEKMMLSDHYSDVKIV